MKYFLATKPKAHQRQRGFAEFLVRVKELERNDYNVVLYLTGVVEPASIVDISPQISGQIVEINPALIPGGILKKDELLVRIDPKEYELAVQQKKSELVKAEHDFELEKGEQAIAVREYEMLENKPEGPEKDLILRKPQYMLARANVVSARASLEDAELDLERTTITAPFNALVKEKVSDLGARVTPASTICQVIGTDEYWIRLSVPVDDLQWIKIPSGNSEDSSHVKIYNKAAWGRNLFRTGSIERLVGELELKGRMAQVLVSVKDPLCLYSGNAGQPRLLVGMYVRAECQGMLLRNIFAIPPFALRDGKTVWIMSPDDTLEIRPVDVLWRNQDTVIIREGLENGERLIISDLATPVAGTRLRLEKNTDVEKNTLSDTQEKSYD